MQRFVLVAIIVANLVGVILRLRLSLNINAFLFFLEDIKTYIRLDNYYRVPALRFGEWDEVCQEGGGIALSLLPRSRA